MNNLDSNEIEYWKEKIEKDQDSIGLLRKRRGEFVGRSNQLMQVNETLSNHRLTTLIGTAGVGKTHLALEILHSWRLQDQHHAAFCDLSSATNNGAIIQEISNSLSCVVGPIEPLSQIASFLNEQTNLLLVVDNAEHVIEQTKNDFRDSTASDFQC